MSGWVAFAGPATLGRGLGTQRLPDEIAQGTFIFDLALGPEPRPIGLLAGDQGLALHLDPEAGVHLARRQGRVLHEARLPLRLPSDLRRLRLAYSWTTAEGQSLLTLETAGGTRLGRVVAAGAPALSGAEAERIFTAALDPAVQWMGLAQGQVPGGMGAALGAGCLVQTPAGPVRADALRPGDLVLTEDHGAQAVAFVRRQAMPGFGSLTPVRLRGPYFGMAGDLIVAPNTLVQLRGAEVEYLFAEDEVLVQARHLSGNVMALPETRRPLIGFVALGFARPELLRVGFCTLCSAAPSVRLPLPRRVLQAYEVIPLLAMRDRARTAAA